MLVVAPDDRSHPGASVPARARGYQVDFEPVTVGPGQLLHVRPGQAVGTLVPASEPARTPTRSAGGGDGGPTTAALAIDPDVAPPGLFRGHVPGGSVARGSDPGIAALATDLVGVAAGSEPDQGALIAGAGYLLHRLALTDRRPGVGSPGGALLTDFLAALELSFATDRPLGVDRSVGELARQVGASPRTLARTTGSLLGLSPKEVVDGRVALQARRLLAGTTLSAARIGWALGFSQPTNFTKFFIRTTGLSPLEFRASW